MQPRYEEKIKDKVALCLSDQMLELKEAQFSPKLTKKEPKQFFAN